MLKMLLICAVTIVAFGSRASAQTYDPRHPVCMHVYGTLEGDRIDCDFETMPQCYASASGRPATCLVNPYWIGDGRRVRRHR